MISLHEAIRNIQDELIKSEQERIQKGIPRLFETEKLTLELSCVFSETDSTDTKGGIHALSVLALDAASANTVSSEKVQKVVLEFKTVDAADMDAENADRRSIPVRNAVGKYPHKDG